MKTTPGKFRILIGVLLVLAIFLSCSSERDPGTLPNIHPASWSDNESPDFHGKSVTLNSDVACKSCHGEDLDGGKVEVSCIDCHASAGVCSLCHGGLNDDSGAPPFGLRGETDSTTLAVGAHNRHLVNPKLSSPVACRVCHYVPATLLDSAHFDYGQGTLDSIAELTFSAPVDPDTAVWNHATGTCSNVYCHGQFDGGEKGNAPVWNMSGQANCGSCHAVFDNYDRLGWKHDEHVRLFDLLCIDCHKDVVDSTFNIIGTELHVNAVVDTSILDQALCNVCHGSGAPACNLCHGGKDNNSGAPPYSLSGDSLRTIRAIGAHTVHLEGDRLSSGVVCEDCHIVPNSFGDPGHYDTVYSAELTFSTFANPSTVWDTAAASCANSYCHGNFPGGYVANIPIWTGDSTEAFCGSCHDVGASPADISHTHEVHIDWFNFACNDCHSAVVDSNDSLINLGLHINGITEVVSNTDPLCSGCHTPDPATCVTCHGGTDNQTGAPPVGLRGELTPIDLAVGAHTIHLEGNWASNGFACSECHTVPVTAADFGHYALDSIAELNFGPLADPSAQYSFGSGQCNNVYCHGNFPNGYSFTPIWNASGQAQCGSCHAVEATANDLSGKHKKHIIDKGKFCSDCHATVVSTGVDPVIIGKYPHVNGSIEITFDNGSGTYDPIAKRCSDNGSGCHNGSEDW